MTCFLVADETAAVLGGTVVTLAPPPTLTPLPDAETPVRCNESRPRVGRRRLDAASPSAASLTNVSVPAAAPLSPPPPTDNRTLNSLPLPFVAVVAAGVDALPLPLAVLGPGVDALDFDVPITLCKASGKVDDAGGAKMDNAADVSSPPAAPGAGLCAASLSSARVDGDPVREGDSPPEASSCGLASISIRLYTRAKQAMSAAVPKERRTLYVYDWQDHCRVLMRDWVH